MPHDPKQKESGLSFKTEYFAIFFVIALQVQTSLYAHGDYLGVRLNLADIFLPFMGLYVLQAILIRKRYWPAWDVPYILWWLAALSVVMSLSLMRGIYINGYISNWALINKYIGFFVLVAYFLLGGWIATNSGNVRKLHEQSTLAMSGFFVAIIILSFLFTILHKYTGFLFTFAVNPWSGFLGNRNVLMVFAVLVMMFLIFFYKEEDGKREGGFYIYSIYLSLLPIFFVYNASRTGWILFSILLVVLAITKTGFTLKWRIMLLVFGGCVAFISINILDIQSPQGQDQYKHFSELVSGQSQEGQKMYIGDEKRLIALEDGLDLYAATGYSLLGSGLGTYKPFQIKKRGEYIDVIDCTPLWLFVETGPLGLVTFFAFFCACLWGAGSKKLSLPENRNFRLAAFAFLIAFAFISLLHEVLYTRVLWFILGMALAKNINAVKAKKV